MEDQDASGGNTLSDAGAAYIFKREGTSWVQQQKIVASDRGSEDRFGKSVSINGDYAIVGSYYEDQDVSGGNTLDKSGSAYIFKRDGTSWVQQQKIVASDRGSGEYFGNAVSISDDYVIVGASYGDKDASGGNTLINAGSAYIFKRSGTTWTQETKLVASDRENYDYFGKSVSISGDHVIIGAFYEDEDVSGGNTLDKSGSAYIFKRSGTTWTQEAKITASDRGSVDWFGTDVSINGDYAIVGSVYDDEDVSGGNTLDKSGSAYVFKRSGTTWTQETKIVATDRESGAQFGASVSISGDFAIVGAREKQAGGFNKAGSAYIFKRSEPHGPRKPKLHRATLNIMTFSGTP